MDHMNWMELLNENTQLAALEKTNSYTEKYGLQLTEQDARLLLSERKNSLKEQQRIELKEGVLPKIIYAFCDSDYIYQDNYVDTLLRLQDIFYLYKNETMDELTDDELLAFMKEQFETVCFGDPDYLENTCLDLFSQAGRAGYRGYQSTGGSGEYSQFDIVTRWDKELYLEALRDLCWK